jgi:pimeloyl-ACP methyl ester carboxylesterase
MEPSHFSNLNFRHVTTNGIALHIAESGSRDGPLVILLHGFPEFWYGWRHQIRALAAAGYWVVAVDQRGYNLSDKPAGKQAYDLDFLTDDIAGIADALGRDRFSIVGHDWGGIIAWWAAGRYPQRLDRFAVLNAAHPSVWREAIKNDRSQRRKSWYIGMFQLPAFPEWAMRRRRFRVLIDTLKSAARPDAFSDDDLHLYRGAWEQPGALTGMVDWYRAIAAKDLPAVESIHIEVPALILWGVNDKYAIRNLAERMRLLCTNVKVEYFERATHWLQHDEPSAVSDRLVDFLSPLRQGNPGADGVD